MKKLKKTVENFFEKLPSDCIGYIFFFIPQSDIINILLSSKSIFYNFVINSTNGWMLKETTFKVNITYDFLVSFFLRNEKSSIFRKISPLCKVIRKVLIVNFDVKAFLLLRHEKFNEPKLPFNFGFEDVHGQIKDMFPKADSILYECLTPEVGFRFKSHKCNEMKIVRYYFSSMFMIGYFYDFCCTNCEVIECMKCKKHLNEKIEFCRSCWIEWEKGLMETLVYPNGGSVRCYPIIECKHCEYKESCKNHFISY